MTAASPAAADLSATAASDPLLRVQDVGIAHDGSETATPAHASFELRTGEVALLLGPSGSGKSTLALALNGLIPQAVPATVTGSVTVAGLDAATTPVARLSTHVGMVFQDPDAQLVTGTLLDEVAFGPENLRLPVDEVLARAEDALRRVGLWERRTENPDRLSGGGRQRLAIACALALGSPLLVLDEPTANLDPAGIEEVYATLADVVASGGRSILLVEHNLDAAMAITDRVVVLDQDGRTVADGDRDSVLRGRAEELHAMGVWLPVSTLAALRLRAAGWTLDPLPLSPGELTAALEAEEAPAARVHNSGESDAASAPTRVDPGPSTPTAPDLRSSAQSTTTTTAAPVLEARGLRVTRGRTEILHGVDVTVHAGEFVAIVGANGAGKTTLLQALAGVIPVPRRQVRIGGADGVDPARTDLRTLARRIGFVFQNPEHQFISHTVFDELAHGLRMQKLPADEVRERTLDVLARFGLEHKADVHPFLLSGGQKRRLSVGTALVAGAPILALDEPTFGQDRARAEELLGLLRELNAAGTTILVVTHDMQLVTEHAQRTIVVGDGRIIADAATSEVFADDALVRRAGLRLPPLRRALQAVTRHPELAGVARIDDLPEPPAPPGASA
ncbi:ABC transporter ATP-binding protein [Microbacterium telephonicum]|uniref:Energy-coupling factor transport system ATP-binding protein n=1 Tax=Microbacterium telephonicum TaxID=1714841 RepID=A0A498CJC1_9MICO|nr:ABC transporter ATP-binding protein [Microbacterium telephonicum]RLK52351.1 energy-coupling factor transport system ATP-binding protein [Microbacterium telephonicum]